MAEINYAKSYVGADRQFASSYEGAITDTPIHHYLGAYTKTYLAQYTATYLGNYVKQYGKQYTGQYTGVFTTQYAKQYSSQFEGSFATQYEGVYLSLIHI